MQYHGPSKWVWLRLEIKQNHRSILKNKDVIYYQLRPDLQTYGHGPRYTADADAAVIDVCTQKYQVAAWWLLLPQRSSSESNGDMWIKFFMYVTFLRRRRPSHIRCSAWNDSNPLKSVHVHCCSYFLWHTCAYCSQIDIDMERFIWSKLADIHLAHGAAYGDLRE